LELQNVGTEPVRFIESDSFLKNGSHLKHHWDAFVDGEHQYLGERGAPGDGSDGLYSPPGWEKLTPAEKDAAFETVKRRARERELSRELDVTLAPGEAIVSRPWRRFHKGEAKAMLSRGEDPRYPRFTGQFREMYSHYGLFEEVGSHQVKFIFSDPPPNTPTEREIQEKLKRGFSRESQLGMFRDRTAHAIGVIESNTVRVEITP
jgi:hypothetical protein